VNPKPPINQALGEVIAHQRAVYQSKKPKPTPQVVAGETITLSPEQAARQAARLARNEELAREEQATADAQARSRWNARAEKLEGFPAQAVLDANEFGEATRKGSRWARLLRCIEIGAVIVMRGPGGTCKTVTATVLARHFIATKQARAAYWRADEYLAEMGKYTQGFSARMTQAEWLKTATARDALLVLDELDKVPGLYAENYMAKQVTMRLFSIIEERHSATNRPTVLIGNFDENTWNTLIHESIRERVKTGGVPFNFGGESKRKART
jgi:DNA replication protein DnaC